MNESVIDIPRRTYAPNVFDDEKQNDPKIKKQLLTTDRQKHLKNLKRNILC